MDTVKKGFTYIGILLDAGIYTLINSIYKIYMALANAQLLTSNMFTEIANRFYAVIGIVMLFFLSYVIIQGIVAPDSFSSKAGGEGSAIIKRVVIAVIGIALVPGVFRVAYKGQKLALEEDIIGKIFLGYGNYPVDYSQFSIDGHRIPSGTDVELEDAMKTSGGTLAALTTWRAMFHPNLTDEVRDSGHKLTDNQLDEYAKTITPDENEGSVGDRLKGNVAQWGGTCALALIAGGAAAFITGPFSIAAGLAVCGAAVASVALPAITDFSTQLGIEIQNLEQAYIIAAQTGNFLIFTAFSGSVASGKITYNFILATALGIILIYMFFSFAIDMAVRAVKLSYMEIIAPIPLMLQILPKFKDNFQKWLKTTISLFIEVFLRLTFIYVVLFLLSHLDIIISNQAFENANLNSSETFVFQAILVIGMLLFAKTAPQFISETLGIASGNMNLGIRQKLAESGVLGLAAGAAGLAGSAVQGLGNTSKGFLKGWANGWRNGIGGSKNPFARIGAGLGKGLAGAGRGTRNLLPTMARAIPRAVKDVKGGKTYGDIAKAAKEGYKGSREYTDKRGEKAERNREIRRIGREKWKAKHPDAGRFGQFVGGNIAGITEQPKGAVKNWWNNLTAPSKYEAEAAARQIEARNLIDSLRKNALESSEILKDGDVAAAQEEVNRLNASTARAEIRRELGLAEGENEAKVSRRLAERKAQAAKDLDAAKDAALQRKIAETQLTGKNNDVTRRIASYLNEHREAIQKLSGMSFADRNNNVETFGNALKSMFGAGATSGKPTFDGAVTLDRGAELQIKLDNDTLRFFRDSDGKSHFERLVNGRYTGISDADARSLISKSNGMSSVLTRESVPTGYEEIVQGNNGDYKVLRYKDGKLVETALKEAQLEAGKEVYLADGTKIVVGDGGKINIGSETEEVTISGNNTKVNMSTSSAKKKAGNGENASISTDGLSALFNGNEFEIDGVKYRINGDGKLEKVENGTTTTIPKDGDGRTTVDVDTLRKLAKAAQKQRIEGIRLNGDTDDQEYVVGTDGIERTITNISDLQDNEAMEFTHYGHTVKITKKPDGKYIVNIDGTVNDGLDLGNVEDLINATEVVFEANGEQTETQEHLRISNSLIQKARDDGAKFINLADGRIIEFTLDGYLCEGTNYKTLEDLVNALGGAEVTSIQSGALKEKNKIKQLMDRIQEHIDREGR